MKNLFLALFILTATYSQQFHSLDGIEDQQRKTLLLFRLGSEQYQYNPIFKYNVLSGFEHQIMDAHEIYYPVGADIKTVWDFEFFSNDTLNFINIGDQIYVDYGSYIAKNDSIVFGSFSPFYKVDISKQNPQKVFVFNGSFPIRSWDGGLTFPIDSIGAITNFAPYALSEFDDQVMFGLDEFGNFAKNAEVVDTSLVEIDQYFKMCYDVDQFHIYRVNSGYDGFSFNVSNNKGNAFTWTKTYQSENPIFISIDSTQSGVIYLADGKQIYKSTNNGYNFAHYKSLPRKLVGIYKKPNSEIIYAASKYQLYEVRPDTTIIIKSVSVPEIVLEYYPLSIGNKWIYLETIADFNGIPHTYSYEYNVREVLKDTLLANGYNYFKIFDQTTMNNHSIFYERIDSINGFVYRYNDQVTTGNDEYLIDDLLAEVGDTILSSRSITPYSYIPNVYCLDQGIYNNFGLQRTKKSFRTEFLSSYSYGLIIGIGLDSIFYDWDFGYSQSMLKGFIIDGIIYGDTTFTDVDEVNNSIPTEYKLEQNYPNPFNPSTKISWQSPVASWQTLKVFDVLGREVATLVDEYRNAGSYDVEFRIKSLELSSGIYFYQLKAGGFVQTKKMMVIK